MANPVSTVNVSLNSGVTLQKNISTIVFFDAHNYFTENVRTYEDITGVAADLPTDSRSYIAAEQAFGADVPPAEFKLARRICDTEITPTGVADAQVYNVTITVTGGDSVVATYTAGAPDDEEAVVDGLLADIAAATGVTAHITAAKVGTGTSATLTIAATTAADDFAVSTISDNLDIAFINDTAETATDLLAKLREEDDEFYVITAYDKTETFVLAMDAATTAATKIYATTFSDTSLLTPLAQPATDVGGKLQENDNIVTLSDFHHEAETKFPEVRAIVDLANSKGGDYVVASNYVQGIPASQDPSTGKLLTATQRGYLRDRNVGYFLKYGKSDVIRDKYQGKTAGGEWISVVRNRDIMQAEIQNGVDALMLRTPVIPFIQSGAEQVINVAKVLCDRRTSTDEVPNILESETPYLFPEIDVNDIPLVDKQNGVFNYEFDLYQAGAIRAPKFTVNLTYSQDV